MAIEENTHENLAQTLARELPVASVVLQDDVANGARHMGALRHLAVPKGFNLIAVDNEDLQPNPRRAVDHFNLHDLASFVEYTKRHAGASTVTWCDFNPQTFELAFRTVFDDHAKDLPGWRNHTAGFLPDMSVEWKAWKGKNSVMGQSPKPFGQLEFAEWIENHADEITAALPGIDGLPTSLQMLTMATEFQANEERVLKSTVRLNSGGVRLTYIADPDKGTTEEMRLFERFGLGIPVFHDGASFPIQCRLRYRANSGKVVFYYEMMRPDLVHKAAALKLIDEVRTSVGVPFLMGGAKGV